MKNSKDYVASLARGIEIIRAFTAQQGTEPFVFPRRIRPADALTLSQVAERVGVARAVARRFLLTLADLGYVVTDGKYFRLTARVLDLGYAYLSSMPLSHMATEFLEKVTEETKESSSASVLNGHDIIYVARVPTRRILSIAISIGTRLRPIAPQWGACSLLHCLNRSSKNIWSRSSSRLAPRTRLRTKAGCAKSCMTSRGKVTR